MTNHNHTFASFHPLPSLRPRSRSAVPPSRAPHNIGTSRNTTTASRWGMGKVSMMTSGRPTKLGAAGLAAETGTPIRATARLLPPKGAGAPPGARRAPGSSSSHFGSGSATPSVRDLGLSPLTLIPAPVNPVQSNVLLTSLERTASNATTHRPWFADLLAPTPARCVIRGNRRLWR